jgi:hypothetical protein
MAVLSDGDALRWHRLAGRIAEATERRLDGRVVANRVRTWRDRWTLEPLEVSLRRARAAAAALSGATLLVRTDVAEFYPSVTPKALADTLARLGVPPEDATGAREMVEGWSSDGCRGLPIGPPGSAVLANAVLATVDVSVAGLPFVRWVDDYLIGVRSERHGEEVLERLDHALALLGLRRSEPKTTIGGPADPAWLRASPCGTRR